MRTKYSIKNSITSFISNIVTFIFLFIGQTIFIKILGVEYVGLNGLFSNVLILLDLFELGIGNAITYNLYKYTKINDEETIKSIMHFYKKAYYYISIIIFVIGLLIIPFLKYIVNDVTVDINIYVVYILFLLSTISTYLIAYKRNLLNAYQRNYISNLIHILCVILVNILQILVLYFTKNYYLYLIIKLICILLENILITFKANSDYSFIVDKNVKPLDKDIKDNIINRVKALIIHKASSAVKNGTDNIIISAFLGIKTLGLYTNYFYIIKTVKSLLINTISITSSVGNLLLENNYEKSYITFRKINFIFLWLSIFTSTCLLLLTEPFISLWVGKDYLLDRFVLIVLVINYFQVIMRSSYSIFKDAAGIWIEDKYVPIIQIVINIVFSILLLKMVGLAGVFMGSIISNFAVWFYSYPKFIYKKLFKKSVYYYLLNRFKEVLLFIVILLVSYLVNMYSSNIITSFIICLLVPNILLVIVFYKTNEFTYFINLIKSAKYVFKK